MTALRTSAILGLADNRIVVTSTGNTSDRTTAVTEAAQRAIDSGRELFFIGGNFYFQSPVAPEMTGNLRIDGAPGTELRWDASVATAMNQRGLFEFFNPEGAPVVNYGNLGVTKTTGITDQTTLTADVDLYGETLSLDDMSGITYGSVLHLYSSGEYFNGMTNVGGFRTATKSISVEVLDFDAGAKTVTLIEPIRESFDATNFVVTVDVQAQGPSVSIGENITLVGLGLGSAHLNSAFGPAGFIMHGLANCDIRCSARDLGSFAGDIRNCMHTKIINPRILGFDPSNSTNHPNRSIWAYPFVMTGGAYLQASGIEMRNGRRGFDANSSGLYRCTVATAIQLDGILEQGVNEAAGTHFSRDVVASNIQGKSFHFRGRNLALSGCDLALPNGNTSSQTIIIGTGPGNNTVPEHPNAGAVNVQGTTKGVSAGLYVRIEVDHLKADYSAYGGNRAAFRFDGKGLQNADIKLYSNATGIVSEIYAVDFLDTPFNPLEYCEDNNFDVECKNYSGTFRIRGTNDIARPTRRMTLKGTCKSVDGAEPQSVVNIAQGGWFDFETIDIMIGISQALSATPIIYNNGDPADYTHMTCAPGILIEKTQLYRKVIILRQTGTTIPGYMTVLPGMIILNSAWTDGTNLGWICTVRGTGAGDLTGVTIDTTSGSKNIVLHGNSGFKVFPGACIVVAGAGTNRRITSMAADGASATWDLNATGTVSGITPTFLAPQFDEWNG